MSNYFVAKAIASRLDLIILMKAFLVYPIYFATDGSHRTIGGIQTYITVLAKLLASEGITPLVIQVGNMPFELDDHGLTVIGCTVGGVHSDSNLAQSLWKEVKARANFTRDYVIFCTDSISVPTDYSRAILIQHGISWDIPLDLLPSNGLLRCMSTSIPAIGYVRKNYQAYRYRKMFNNTKTRICVDYNFPNWLRTQEISLSKESIWVIPNCVFPTDEVNPLRTEEYHAKKERAVNVLYARRFERYRGSRLMADAVDIVCSTSLDINFTFAGEGSDSVYLKSRFAGNDRVLFTRYDAGLSLTFHAAFDIAVIPSLASEGTSLSVLEAMAAGCAVIATPVGGITNILIDGFNGLYTNQSAEMLASRIQILSADINLRKEITNRAFETVTVGAFSYNAWRSNWIAVIASLT